MAGLYIHIPFCKQACHYCNFHFSTTFDSYRQAMIVSLQKELILQADFFGKTPFLLDSVYFGGGTPSLLSPVELQSIWETILKHFRLKTGAEVTLEANPDDINAVFLSALRDTPVNRLSIGIQSFRDEDLRFLNRSHDAKAARNALDLCRQAGMDNISADLIFGIPGSDINRLEKDVNILSHHGIPHISAYGLTVEPKTALESMISKGKAKPVCDEQSGTQMEWLMKRLPELGYEQYEISNYALPGMEARHNSSYWEEEPYLGIGPGAHSFIGEQRRWNISSNAAYIRSINSGQIPAEAEKLTPVDRFNEYIMTGLRTRKGISSEQMQKKFGEPLTEHFLREALMFIEEGSLLKNGDIFTLSPKGKLQADFISQTLFYIHDS